MKRIIYIAVMGLILILIFNYAYTQERITLSTYYPAPYGEYRKLAIGSSTGGYTAPSSPDIDLVVEGSVGIGTTSPGAKLHAVGNTVVGGLYTSIFSDAPAGQTGNSIAIGIGGTKHWTLYDEANANNRLDFYNSNNSAAVMTLQQNGNVGIGTASPAEELHVVGTAQVGKVRGTTADGTNDLEGLKIIRRDNSGTHGIFFNSNVGDTAGQYWENMLIYNDGGGSNIGFWTGPTATERMRITAGGNVGIGTTNPGAKLDVAGAVKAGGGYTQPGNNGETLKMIRGRVNFDAGILAGSGFTTVWRGTGQYTINFDSGFSGEPAVITTLESGTFAGQANIVGINPSQVLINTTKWNSALINTAFHFVAIGVPG